MGRKFSQGASPSALQEGGRFKLYHSIFLGTSWGKFGPAPQNSQMMTGILQRSIWGPTFHSIDGLFTNDLGIEDRDHTEFVYIARGSKILDY